MKSKSWSVYLLECLDGTLYTGITNDVDNRMKLHSSGRGSKYVFRKGFGRLLFSKECGSKSDACKCEYQIKQLSKDKKIDWFSNRAKGL